MTERSGSPTRVFVARLAGLVVFDPNGDQVGRVRDVVIMLRLGNQQPRVLGSWSRCCPVVRSSSR
jgi:sporulation protein YlmC with PRC-barrel domain